MPRPNPLTDILNYVDKFVACRTLAEPLSWGNSHLLKGEAVGRLKVENHTTLVIFGSAVLVQSLMQRNLIDEIVLQIHPIVLGKGCRLFAGGTPLTKLTLVGSLTTSTGVIVATYQLGPPI